MDRADAEREFAYLVDQARRGVGAAVASLDAYIDRLGRALALVVIVVDPDILVMGGDMSDITEWHGPPPGVIPPRVR